MEGSVDSAQQAQLNLVTKTLAELQKQQRAGLSHSKKKIAKLSRAVTGPALIPSQTVIEQIAVTGFLSPRKLMKEPSELKTRNN